MFWADQLLEKKIGKEVINDSWTPSGIIHMGSLKGPVIHDTLYKLLKEKKTDVTFMYGFDDMDPIDGLPANLMKTHEKYLGIPIFQSPSPDGNGTFGDYFGRKMKALLDALDIRPDTLYRTSELYKKGTFNNAIKIVLDNAAGVRKVYGDMYKKAIPDTWFPFPSYLSKCGKLGTTKVTGWDGESRFVCEPGHGCLGKRMRTSGSRSVQWKRKNAVKVEGRRNGGHLA
jgi:lysyl-tRNA synthetase class 1